MLIPIDEVVHFDVITSSASTGAVTDADSTPTFDVYEEATDTGMLGATNLTKRTSLTGNYRGSFTASAVNGFEAGKWYSVVASATVSTIAGKCVAMSFRCVPAESSAGVPKVDTSYYGGTAGTFSGGRPEVNTTHLAGTAYGSADFSVTMKASINTEADTALTDYGALKPTVAGRTLDVSATGEGGVDWANVGSPTTAVDLSGTTISTSQVVASVTGAVGSLGAVAKSDVNSEVVDALNVDTYAEPGQGTPPATATLVQKIGYLYKNWRNKKTQTASAFNLFNDDAVTVDQKTTVSDDGTTATKGEITTGP